MNANTRVTLDLFTHEVDTNLTRRIGYTGVVNTCPLNFKNYTYNYTYKCDYYNYNCNYNYNCSCNCNYYHYNCNTI